MVQRLAVRRDRSAPVTVIPWGRAVPLAGYRLEAGAAEARERSARGWLLDAIRLHAAGELGELWRLLDLDVAGGRKVVAELASGLLELHAELAPFGTDTLYAGKRAAGFVFFLHEAEAELNSVRQELGLVPVFEWDDEVTGRRMVGCFWPEGPRHLAKSVLAFEEDLKLPIWRDCSGRLAEELRAERQRIEQERAGRPPAEPFPEEPPASKAGAGPEAPAEGVAAGPPAAPPVARADGPAPAEDLVPAVLAVGAETLRLQALELRRRALERRAQHEVGALMARLVSEAHWPRTVWDEAFTGGQGWERLGAFHGDALCMFCGKSCAGLAPVLIRRAEAEKPELVLHVLCVEPGYLAQRGPYGSIADMGGWLQDRGFPLPAWAGFALAELLVITYRRIYDLEALDWSSRPQKTARKARPCAICAEPIGPYMRYVDGGGTEKSAHPACAGVEEA